MNGLKSSERTSKMTVSVRILAGRTINVEVCPADTVHTLKFISQTIGRIRADQQLLTFAGKAMLDDCKTRSDYNVTNGSTVYLSLRLLGGGHIMTSTPRVAWSSCQPPPLILRWYRTCSRRKGSGMFRGNELIKSLSLIMNRLCHVKKSYLRDLLSNWDANQDIVFLLKNVEMIDLYRYFSFRISFNILR